MTSDEKDLLDSAEQATVSASTNAPNPLVGILLLAHGGPDSLEDIEPFLRNIRGGRGFSQKLLDEITGRYRQIGGRSPLLDISRRQAQALEKELSGKGRFRVYLGMRNWRPFIPQAMQEMQRDGVTRLLALCLAPQNSRMSVGLYHDHVRQAEKDLVFPAPVSFVESYHREPNLIGAFAEKLTETLAGFHSTDDRDIPVIFTAHSLPEKVLANGDPYDAEARETAAAVAERCGIANYRFAYQSQGATEEKWLGPTVESVIEELSQTGCRQAIVAPIGFVADHVEVLWDIDIHFRRFAHDRGIELRRTASLNDSPTFIRALADVVEKYFQEG